MGLVSAIITTLSKGKKKLKTLISVPNNNFQSYSAILNSNDELEIVGTDGNGVAFQQTLRAAPGTVVFFNTTSRNFEALQLQGEVNPDLQYVSVVREIA